MCEPAHSIVQFDPTPKDDDHDDHNDPGQSSEMSSGYLSLFLGKTGKWLRKIGGMFHFSTMGKGHSEALNSIGVNASFFAPVDTKYEAHWWNRNFVLDGYYKGSSQTLDRFGRWVSTQSDPGRARVAFDNAKEYANLVSIGSLHALRQFLGDTIDKADYTQQYVARFRDMLNQKGKVQYDRKLKAADLYGKTIWKDDNNLPLGVCETVKRICLGFTRKRDLLVPEWADDGTLWTPPARKLVMA